MLTDLSRIAKVRDFINVDTFQDKRLSAFWKKWSWKGAFLNTVSKTQNEMGNP